MQLNVYYRAKLVALTVTNVYMSSHIMTVVHLASSLIRQVVTHAMQVFLISVLITVNEYPLLINTTTSVALLATINHEICLLPLKALHLSTFIFPAGVIFHVR